MRRKDKLYLSAVVISSSDCTNWRCHLTFKDISGSSMINILGLSRPAKINENISNSCCSPEERLDGSSLCPKLFVIVNPLLNVNEISLSSRKLFMAFTKRSVSWYIWSTAPRRLSKLFIYGSRSSAARLRTSSLRVSSALRLGCGQRCSKLVTSEFLGTRFD